jgi:hypothetical protein
LTKEEADDIIWVIGDDEDDLEVPEEEGFSDEDV